MAESQTHLVFNKSQRARSLLEDFNRALGEIKKNGIYAQIVDKIGAVDK